MSGCGWSQEAIDVAALMVHAAEVLKSGHWCFHVPKARQAARIYKALGANSA